MKNIHCTICMGQCHVWGMRSVERRKVGDLFIKCLKSFVGVSRMDGFRNAEVCEELQ